MQNLIKSIFNRDLIITPCNHLVLDISITMATLFFSFLFTYAFIRYVILTTHSVEHLINAFELRALPPYQGTGTIANVEATVANTVEVISQASHVVGDSINSGLAMESVTIADVVNTTNNTTTSLIGDSNIYPIEIQPIASTNTVNDTSTYHLQ
jgi:hypothetical protein